MNIHHPITKLISNFDGSAGLAIILETKIICLLMEGIQYKPNLNLVKTLVLEILVPWKILKHEIN